MEQIGKLQNNQKYWQDFYSRDHILAPSDFCLFLLENYDISNKEIVDICCGNGRDTYALGIAAKKAIGVDFANEPVNEIGVEFVQSDINDYLSDKSDLSIYSRFGFHAFDEQTENCVIDSAKELYLEFRSDKDNQFVDDHYRKLIKGNGFLNKLIDKDFTIRYFVESKGLAVYKTFDPYIIRVICRRK